MLKWNNGEFVIIYGVDILVLPLHGLGLVLLERMSSALKEFSFLAILSLGVSRMWCELEM